MANPQTENGFLQLANEIWNEVIRRDFSKRQKDIIFLIWRLSYGCKKKSAYIPMLKDFELCGIGKTNITKELNYLVQMKVISWDRDVGIFAVMKDYERWQVSPVRGWDEERFKKLISENLERAKQKQDQQSYQNDNSESPKPTVKSYQINNRRVIKTITLRLLKQELKHSKTPCRCRAERVPKESIKEIFKETQEETAMDAYRFSFKKLMYTGHIQGYVMELLKRGFTDAFIREVFLEMGARGIGADERYMRKLAEDWISRGIYTRVEAERRREESKNGRFRAGPDKPAKTDPELESRRVEIARNKWISEGNDPNEFTYLSASGG